MKTSCRQLPTISVVVPTHNSERTLTASLQSVIEQRYRGLEVLIIDNLSTDRTLAIARAFEKEHDYIRVISARDSGVYDAMNNGIALSCGEWIYFLGSDDRLEPHALMDVFRQVEPNEVDILYGDVRFDTSGEIYDGEFSISKLLRKNLCHQAVFYRRQLFDRFGLYDCSYELYADWEFNWRCFGAEGVRIKYVPVVVAEFSNTGLTSKQVDDRFNFDRPNLILKYCAAKVDPGDLHRALWPHVCRYIENSSLGSASSVIMRAAFHTRRPLRYIIAGAYWRIRSSFHARELISNRSS